MQDVRGITILVVDDEPELRDTIVIEFEMLGIKAVGAATANEAIEIMKKTTIDVLLSDVLMPGGGGTGVELLDRMQAEGITQPITFLMTGFSDLLDEVAYEKGIEGIFTKPFSRSEMVNAVIAAVKARAANRKAA